jgi:hypothetical protein
MFGKIKRGMTTVKAGQVWRNNSEDLIVYLGTRATTNENLIWSPDKGVRWVNSGWFDREHKKTFYRDTNEIVMIDLPSEGTDLTLKQFNQVGKKPWDELIEHISKENVHTILTSFIRELESKMINLRF